MTDQIEQLLRDRLPRAVSTVSADDEFWERAVTHSVGFRRGRRRTWWLSSAAVVAAVMSVAVGVSVVAHDRRAPGSQVPPVTHTRGERSPLGWARGLPAGAPPALAYVLDGTLHQGTTTVPAPGEQTEILGDVDGGWLVFRE